MPPTAAVQDVVPTAAAVAEVQHSDEAQLPPTSPQSSGSTSKRMFKWSKPKDKPKDKPVLQKVSLRKLFSLATPGEKALMALGIAASLVSAAAMPTFIVMFGRTLDGLNKSDTTDITATVNKFCIVFLVVGTVSMLAGFVYVLCWSITGERQALRLKEAYVQSILRQDVGWFDENPAGELPSMVASLIGKVQDGMGRKVPDITMNLFGGIGCIVAALYLNPVLTGIVLCCLPFTATAMALVSKVMSKSTLEGQKHYSRAGAVANEVFGGIRTVASLCAEPIEMARYAKWLVAAEKAGIKNGTQNGLGLGTMMFCFFMTYALAFWYGIHQVSADLENGCTQNCTTGGKIISAVFGILVASMELGQMAPGVTALMLARTSAVRVFEAIDRTPPIDSFSEEGLKPADSKGEIAVESVAFHYPARKSDLVYEKIDLHVAPGETLALVGPSGGGKSTMTKLFLRFYDPTSGCIRLDGTDIRELNVNWYRQQIGYVGQEPVLFYGTIRDNIANGKPGATDEDIINAAKAANAHDFISKFPHGYKTEVGDGGLQLSGGQKQRVAIARAIIKDPSILLLDEATSALDTESEGVVQKALDNLQKLKKRTTITIAHRLSTIQNSDRIAVIANKGVAELGTHSELLAKGGIYAQLCASQGRTEKPKEVEAAGDDDIDIEVIDGRRRSTRASSASAAAIRKSSVQVEANKSSSAVRLKSFISGSDADGVEGTDHNQAKAPMSRLWALNKPDWPYILMGLIGACIAGAISPVQGVIIAQVQAIFYYTDPEAMRSEGYRWIIGFVVLAVAVIVGYTMMSGGFATAGERMTRRLRETAFSAIVRHDIGWFDAEQNSVGALTSRLEEDALSVGKATGVALGHKVQLIMTLAIGVFIGLIFAWQVGLVACAVVPLIGVGSILQTRIRMGAFDTRSSEQKAAAGMIISAALNGVTTVQAFNLQKAMCARYSAAVIQTLGDYRKTAVITGLAFGYSQGMMFWVFALLFYYGSTLVANGTVTFQNFFVAIFAVILGARGSANVHASPGEQSEGQKAAARIFALQDEPLKIDPLSESGAKPPQELKGAIRYKHIKFAYPTRPEHPIYGGPLAPEGFSLDIKAGETVALVGTSGGGKSTCIALLMRFYDPASGTIEVDGRNIQELNVHWLRSNIGYVGQEPVLFTGTIRDNIAKGCPDATQQQIEEAAKAANAHEFIMSFAQGYDTDVGEKSALLSGGQKQRIAIARAILRDPNILLLDEATSALDNESERQVQAALDHLQSLKRRTTLVVAHRLTTICNADKIAVLGNGHVVELGTHNELMAKDGGLYGMLYRRQTQMFEK